MSTTSASYGSSVLPLTSFGFAAPGPTVPAGHSHDLVALERHQALVVVMVDGRQVLDQARGWLREPGEEAAVHGLG